MRRVISLDWGGINSISTETHVTAHLASPTPLLAL